MLLLLLFLPKIIFRILVRYWIGNWSCDCCTDHSIDHFGYLLEEKKEAREGKKVEIKVIIKEKIVIKKILSND